MDPDPAKYYDTYIEGPHTDESEEYHGWAADGPYDEWLAKHADAHWKSTSKYRIMLKCYGKDLSIEDRQLLALRNERFTMARIAEIMGFKSHAGAVNRLKRLEERCDNDISPKAGRGSAYYSRGYWCRIRLHGKPHMKYLCVANGFTSCRNCLREDKPDKRDDLCRDYRIGTICAVCNYHHIQSLRSKPRQRHTQRAKDVRKFVCRWYNGEWH